uniref:RNA helicase n=1 Tax=Parastrongyloides trichosuri TaxID=131310 RepID=A0A0N4ZNR1_PARTI
MNFYGSFSNQRKNLPIFRYRKNIIYLMEKYRTLIIVGETGSGKTTQIPQYLYEAGWCEDGRMIGITQPRRISVLTISSRVAEEMNTNVGGDVGYAIRFDHQCCSETKIKFMTDGVLLRELVSDPLLTKYSIIMVDEAHERSVNTDILLSLLKKVMMCRPDIKLIISSATMNAELFKEYFNENTTDDDKKDTATILSVEGRCYPVDIFYAKDPVPDYVISSVKTCLNIHKNYGSGDILVFLTGMDEVKDAKQLMEETVNRERLSRDFWILGLYGEMPMKTQMLAFETPPYGKRKIVFTTNVAEASLTIPGISFVVDCGFVKVRMVLDSKSTLERLVIIPLSKASAEQRAGRAGRLGVGKCFRLYTKVDFDNLEKESIPEIQRISLAPVLLSLKNLGIVNTLRYNFISRPSVNSMAVAYTQLHSLKAVDESGKLTKPFGERMTILPLLPMESRVLLMSEIFECSDEITSILAMLSIEDPFHPKYKDQQRLDIIRKKFSTEEGDHLTLLNIYSSFINNKMSKEWCSSKLLSHSSLMKAHTIKNQLQSYLKSFNIPIVSCKGMVGEVDKILQCLVSGFFLQSAQLDSSGYYITTQDRTRVSISRDSSINYRNKLPKYIIFGQCMGDSIRFISEVSEEWLLNTEMFENDK